MLRAVGEPPVSDLSSPTDQTQLAIDMLDEVNFEVQYRGWHWNTDLEVDIALTGGEVVLPTNTIRADVRRLAYTDPDYVIRDGKLYDRRGQTYTVSADPFTVDLIVYGLDFEDIPEPARLYIARRAARLFVEQTTEDRTLIERAVARERDAWHQITHDNAQSGDFTIFLPRPRHPGHSS